jgi:DNA-3-methyladenine glycosylase II
MLSPFLRLSVKISEVYKTEKNMHKAITHLKKSDPILAAIIDRVGPYKMQYGEPTFHTLAESILYQQLNGKAAATIFDRFTAAAGDPLTPKGILKLSDAEMRAIGLSRQKTSYLRDLAEKTDAGLLQFDRLADLSEAEVIAHLTQVKGIGVWTAHMFLMFTLRRADILPTGDYGIQAAIKKHYKKRKWPKPAVMQKIAKPWEPYRSIACWYLWRSLDIKTIE